MIRLKTKNDSPGSDLNASNVSDEWLDEPLPFAITGTEDVAKEPDPEIARELDSRVETFLDSFAKGDFKSAEAAANDYSRLVSDDYDNEGQSIDYLNIDSAEFRSLMKQVPLAVPQMSMITAHCSTSGWSSMNFCPEGNSLSRH
jgi:hypothetical protein